MITEVLILHSETPTIPGPLKYIIMSEKSGVFVDSPFTLGKQTKEGSLMLITATCCSGVWMNENVNLIHWKMIKRHKIVLIFKMTTSCVTYSILYATSSLSKQLWLGILHLGSVENLLALHLVQMQEPAEPHGGWKKRNMKTWSWQNIAQSACYYSVPIALTQSSCQGCVRIGLVMDCVYVCVWRERFSELVVDYMGGGRGGLF